jgi:protein-S-isoprenylcysteine O-methyltransferase Ste14
MISATTAVKPPLADPQNGPWSRMAAYLVRRRVRLTLAVIIAMMVEDVLTGVRPHSIFMPGDPASLAGCLMIVAGLAIRSWSAGILKKTRELTTTGPYAVIRNPLYVGSFLVMSGFCTLIGDRENIFIVLGPIAGLYFLQVLHEERVLSNLYNTRWVEYVRRVPRLLPRSFPKSPFATWELSQWLGSREYRGLGATLLGMLAIEFWHLR